MFLAGILYEKSENYKEAGLFYLEGAWACDDCEDFQIANFFRELCCNCLNKYLKQVNDLDFYIILIDTYRRMGTFEKSKKIANKILTNKEYKNRKREILYEISLSEALDNKIHFISEIKNKKDL